MTTENSIEDQKIDSINKSSDVNRNLGLTFVLFLFYVAFHVASTTDMMLVKGTGFRIPLIDVEMPLIVFYIAIPICLLFFHYNVLSNLLDHANRLRIFLDTTDEKEIEKRQQSLHPFLFNDTLTPIEKRTKPTLWLRMRYLIVHSVAFFIPLLLQVYICIRFAAAYRDSVISLFQLICVVLHYIVLETHLKEIMSEAKPADSNTKEEPQTSTTDKSKWIKIRSYFTPHTTQGLLTIQAMCFLLYIVGEILNAYSLMPYVFSLCTILIYYVIRVFYEKDTEYKELRLKLRLGLLAGLLFGLVSGYLFGLVFGLVLGSGYLFGLGFLLVSELGLGLGLLFGFGLVLNLLLLLKFNHTSVLLVYGIVLALSFLWTMLYKPQWLLAYCMWGASFYYWLFVALSISPTPYHDLYTWKAQDTNKAKDMLVTLTPHLRIHKEHIYESEPTEHILRFKIT